MPHPSAPLLEKSAPAVFYFPCLRQELTGGPLPGEVHFLNPGLALPTETANRALIWTPPGLPFDPPGAVRCMQDLIAEGEFLEHDLLLAGAAGGADVLNASAVSPFGASEVEALKAFERTGNYAPGACEDKARETFSRAVREQAQKLLLLCVYLEDNVLAARELVKEISVGEAALQELLRDGEPGGAGDMACLDIASAGDELLEQCLARWTEILRAWLIFLPQEAVFYTTDFAALPGLDFGEAQPLPPAEARLLFPVSAAAGWTFSNLAPEGFSRKVRLISGHCP